jgi:hypothetical protein
MNKRKMIGLAAIGVGLAVALNSNKKDTKLPLPTPTPTPIFNDPKVTPGDSTTPVIQPTNETAVSGIKEDTRELSKDQYNSFRRNDWRAILQMKLNAGKELSSATQELWELWDNPNNVYRLHFKSPVALLLGIIVHPVTKPKSRKEGIGSGSIDYSSTPVYPTWWNWWYYYEDIWTCADWKAYHIALEQHHENTNTANVVWEQAWDHPDNISGWSGMFSSGWQNSPLSTFFRTSTDCRYACTFVEYMYGKEIDISSVFSSLQCSLTNFGDSVFGALEDIGGGIETTAKVAAIALPIAAGVLGYAFVATTKKRIEEKGSR